MKKGSVFDAFFIMVFIIMAGIVFVVSWLAMSKINENFQANDNIAATGKAMMQDMNDQHVAVSDGVFLVAVMGLWITSIILAFQIDTHPVFFFISFFIYILLIVVAAILGNAYYDFAASAEIVSFAEDFTIIPFVMNNFVQIMLGIGFSIGLVMWARPR